MLLLFYSVYKRRLYCFIALFGLCTNAPAATISSAAQLSSDLDRLVSAYEATYGFAGTVKVVAGNDEVWTASFGLADRAFAIPNAPSYRYSINSISKTFTALAVLLLVQDGKLDLHAPIGQHLEYLQAPWKDTITAHQLLTHTTGLPRESGIAAHEQISLREQVVKLVDRQRLAFEAGSQYAYSNSGFTLLGALIEEVAQTSYTNFITERILVPLQLVDTGVYRANSPVLKQATPYRITSSGIEFAQRTKHLGDNAGGGLYSNPNDLYRYVRAIETNQLLKPELTDLMLKAHFEIDKSEFATYGWTIKMFGDDLIYFASGSGQGSKSVLIRSAETKHFIAITSNWGNTPILMLLRDIYFVLTDQDYQLPDASGLARPADYAGKIGDYEFDETELKKQLGIHHSVLRLHQVEGRLFLDDELLSQKAEQVLGLTYTDELKIHFNENRMVVNINGHQIIGNRVGADH